MEDHFDRAPELEDRLLASGKTELYDEIVSITKMANIQYVRQKKPKVWGMQFGVQNLLLETTLLQ